KTFWLFYRKLLAYREHPDPAEALALRAEFDQLFTDESGYDQLDECKARTLKKRDQLLMVLKHPEILLHNNPAELGARQRVRKRDVSLHARTRRGVNCWDIFQTLLESCKKLGVNFYEYVRDRLCREGHIAPLGEIIEQIAKGLELGKSWENELPRPDWHRLEIRAWLR